MICDQCGFEHNSKGTCPKCGARVIYVNEEYEKRRQAYLEAQKKAAAGEKVEDDALQKTPEGVVVPPGVRYSTEDEHNMKKGRDRAPSQYSEDEGDHGISATLSKLAEKFLYAVASLIVWTRKRILKRKKKLQKKRGKNNPVITKLTFEDDRDLQFDDGKETLDTSKLVLDHKVFVDKRIPIAAGILGGFVSVVALIVFLIVWNTTDHTKVFVLEPSESSNAVMITELNRPNKTLWQADDRTQMTLLDHSEDGKTVIASTLAGVALLTKESVVFRLDSEAKITTGKLSKNGQCFAVLGCIAEKTDTTGGETVTEGEAAEGQGSEAATDSNETYILYVKYGEALPLEVARDSYSRVLLDVTDDGLIIYEKLTTAAYGVISSRSIEIYNAVTGQTYLLAENYTDYSYDAGKGVLYYIASDKLYYAEVKAPKAHFMDDAVLAIAEDVLDAYDGVVYQKNYGYYRISADEDTGTLILRTDLDHLSFYYYEKEKVLCVVSQTGSGGTLYVIEDMKATVPVLMSSEPHDTVRYEVRQLLQLDNARGFVYVTDTGICVMRMNGKTVERTGLNASSTKLVKAICSKGKYVLLDDSNQLTIYGKQGEKLENRTVYDIWCVKK